MAIVSGVIGIALWLWMARANNQGKNWARILSTVLFCLATLDLVGVFSEPKTVLGLVFPVLTWLVGLGAVFLLWRPESSAFFKPQGLRVSPAPVVFSAVPTLFSSDGEVDTGANRTLYKFVAGLLDGLLVAGTTGEFPALDDAERLALIELALAEAGPDRVIAHVGAPDARHSARLARAAAALGATRIAAITPYYLPARPDELIAHFGRIREAAADLELYAYIFPERTGLRVPSSVFAALADAVGLAGAKLSGSAAGDLAAYAAAAPGLRLFSGDDSNPAATMRAGGAGLISGRSGAYPEVYAALAAALAAGDVEARRPAPARP